MLVFLSAFVGSALAMEGWAAWVHRVVWHGPLWCIHKSHHERFVGGPRWQHNDVFALLHAAAALALAYAAPSAGNVLRPACLGLAAGACAYGLAYGALHDGLIHGRLWAKRRWPRLLRRIAAAHAAHHQTQAVPYGLFSGPWALRRAARQRREQSCQIATNGRITACVRE